MNKLQALAFVKSSEGKLMRPILIAAIVSGTCAFAQSENQTAPMVSVQTKHTPDPQKQLNHLTKKLALTADQQNQILPILTDRQRQVSSINNDSTLPRKDRVTRLKSVRSDSEAKLRNVLTDTQRTAYDEMQLEARERKKALP